MIHDLLQPLKRMDSGGREFETRLLRRRDAAAYVRETWSFPCCPAWLAKLAVVGGGPLFRKAGRFPVYSSNDLDDWAKSRFTRRVASTSEL